MNVENNLPKKYSDNTTMSEAEYQIFKQKLKLITEKFFTADKKRKPQP